MMDELYESDRVVIINEIISCDESYLGQHGMIHRKWDSDRFTVLLDSSRFVMFRKEELILERDYNDSSST